MVKLFDREDRQTTIQPGDSICFFLKDGTYGFGRGSNSLQFVDGPNNELRDDKQIAYLDELQARNVVEMICAAIGLNYVEGRSTSDCFLCFFTDPA